MKIYIFKAGNGDYIEMEEKQAHNYLKHKSGRERKDLVYIGAADSLELEKKRLAVNAEITNKFGNTMLLSDKDLMKARSLGEELTKKCLDDFYASVDKNVMPKNFDWMGESGERLSDPSMYARFK